MWEGSLAVWEVCLVEKVEKKKYKKETKMEVFLVEKK